MNRRLPCRVVFILTARVALGAWEPLPTVDLARIHPSDFRDTELDMPFYLAHFRELAAGVVEQGSERGFINIPVWRSVRDNKPYNSRIMESILSLAYFYALDRPWNPYHASPALRQRLEASLEYWLRQQNPEGRFAESAPGRFNLAATAFSTKFIGQTLTYLQTGPPIDPDLLRRVIAADRKTIHLLLTAPDLIKYGTFVSNQYTNVFAGGFAYLKLYPDPELKDLLLKRFAEDIHEHQSPAGYFYEEDGPDFEYDLFTHQSNLAMAWDYVRGTTQGQMIVDQERKWFEWLSYNAVPNGDWSSWILNQGIGTRTRRDAIPGKDHPVGEFVPEEHAFATSGEALKADITAERRELEFLWPRVPALEPGTYSPYAFLLRDHRSWFPAETQREAARGRLPYIARKEFNHQLSDDRHPLVFTYVRRPSYYAAFGAGQQLSTNHQQRYGLGLLWNEDMGAVLVTQSGSSTAAWGTQAQGAQQVYEAAEVKPTYRVLNTAVQSKPGSADLPQGVLTITYSLGSQGEKKVEFRDDAIVVTIHHPGQFTEIVPLIQAGDDPPAGFALKIEGPASRTRVPTDTLVGGRKLSVVRIEASGTLSYELRFIR
jgi:hypothetical protein